MAGGVDETRFSGIEPWKNSTSPYPESPWRRLNPLYVISNSIRRLSPHTQTNSPLEPPAKSILPTCGSNISAYPEPISTISTASNSSRKNLSNDLYDVPWLEAVAEEKHRNKDPAT